MRHFGAVRVANITRFLMRILVKSALVILLLYTEIPHTVIDLLVQLPDLLSRLIKYFLG
jgi:hypothetical protein